MTQQPSVIERWLAAGDRGEVEAFDDLLHADVVVHAPAGLSTDSREAEKQVWRDALAAMPDLRHAIQEILVIGETEMARVKVTGTLVSDFGGLRGTGAAPSTSIKPSCAICEVAKSRKPGRSPTSPR